MRARRWLVALLVLVIAAGGTGFSRAKLEALEAEGSDASPLLYLPNGKHLKMMSLGHAGLLADVLYLWAIQYYSNYEREDRYRYVRHVFDSVITELDPHYIDAYWLGALVLIIEAQDVEGGLQLLDKGIANNPDEWILAYLAAWECHHAGRFEQAATYFERAAAIPGAPPVVRRMRAGMMSKAGNLLQALALWREILENPESDAASIAIAERQLRELKVRLDIRTINAALERFQREKDRYPARLEELVAGSYIRRLPRDPQDRPYPYDPREGRVGRGEGRILGER